MEPQGLAELRKNVENIADRLCLAVKGEFDFTLDIQTQDQSIQKLTMLVNFVIDAARRSIIEIKEKNEQLTELDRLKSDFLANISHELRTPLTLILGPLDAILSSNASLPEDTLQNLKRMQRNAARLYTLVNNLLDFSRLEAGKLQIYEEPLDLNQIISQLVDDTQGLACARKLTLEFLPAPDMGYVLLDPKMIEKIVLNLLSNALKFTPEGGKISIMLQRQDNEICLTVSDTGIGISEKQIPFIFERFHQIGSSSTRLHEGSGIGLALIAQCIELMGGKIAVESKEGKGTKFMITFPMRNAKALPPKLNHQANVHAIKASLSSLLASDSRQEKTKTTVFPSGKKGSFRILIVDDNHDMQAYISSLLNDVYDTMAVDNGKIALDAVKEYKPHVILSDVMMPEMDGYQLTKALKADSLTHNIPIILVTAKADSDAVASSLGVGADDYLCKPFSSEELIARTNSAVRHYQEYLKNCELNHQLVMVARRAGMADIATSVLHNVGNILNSVNVSVGIVQENTTKPHAKNLAAITTMIKENIGDLSRYLTEDPKGKILLDYLMALTDEINHENLKIREETQLLSQHVKHIKDIVAMQQSLSGISGVAEKLFLPEIIDIAITACKASMDKRNIELEKNVKADLFLTTDKSKLLQIIVNLIQNAHDALFAVDKDILCKKISIKAEKNLIDSYVDIAVSDNGIGIEKENLDKIFTFGFTTKSKGHGFGLHSSALAAKDLGGSLKVKSEGFGCGSEFILRLPLSHSARRFVNDA